MSDINNERLAKFEGKCWHKTTNEYPFRCAICGQSETDWQGWFICPHNPDYSTSPADRERLWFFLVRDKKEMYYEFHEWAEFNYGQGMYRIDFDIWLMLPMPYNSIPEWLLLLQEWLELPEVVERFGWEECSTCESKGGTSVLGFTVVCPKCNGSGKVRAEWAKCVKEGR